MCGQKEDNVFNDLTKTERNDKRVSRVLYKLLEASKFYEFEKLGMVEITIEDFWEMTIEYFWD